MMTNNAPPAAPSISTSARPRQPGWLLPLMVVIGASAVLVGAYCNWYLWHPMTGIGPTLAAALLILVGGIALLIRSRRIRRVAALVLVAGFGTILGQNVGPDRPPIRQHDSGSVRLVQTAPTAFDASGKATCSSVADASQVVVSPDEFGLTRADEDADFHYLYISIGDMYDYGDPGRRDDHLSILISIQPALVPADGKPGATWLSSDAESVLSLAPGHTVEGGSIAFANLAIGDPADPTRRSDLSGTISWTCGPVFVESQGTSDESLTKEPDPTEGTAQE